MTRNNYMRVLTFAKLLGYENTNVPVFKRRLTRMIEADRIELQRSGYGSDSNKHSKTILIKDEQLIERIKNLRKKRNRSSIVASEAKLPINHGQEPLENVAKSSNSV